MHLLLQMVISHCHVMLVFWRVIVAISLECHSFVVLEGNLINTTSPTMSYGLTLNTLTVDFSALKIFIHFLCILQKFWETFSHLHVFGSGKKYFTWHPTHFGQADKLLDALEAESHNCPQLSSKPFPGTRRLGASWWQLSTLTSRKILGAPIWFQIVKSTLQLTSLLSIFEDHVIIYGRYDVYKKMQAV